MGTSAAGNAYNEMINAGYSKNQARNYAVLVGGSEAGLSYLLGGIGKLGGKVTGKVVSKLVDKVDNILGKVAIQLGGKVLSEVTEENLQSILTPWYKELTTNIQQEKPGWEEIAYNSLITAVTTLALEGGGTVKSVKAPVDTRKLGGRSEAFQADLSQYTERQRATIQSAIDSGILNNTNRTHEFVDFVAKVAGDLGVNFRFADNEMLAESGFAIDGVTVNGFVNEKGVTVNVNSPKALNSVVGHEITHVLEGTDLYESLKSAVETYAKTKGEYDSRLAQLTKLYQGKDGYTDGNVQTKLEREMVADLVGDYLFTDKAFVESLSRENRNVFQKIFDQIKHLCKLATAGSEEARQLEKVKKIFQDVYRGDIKNPTGEGETKYDIVALENGNVYVKASRNIITGKTKADQRKNITEFFKDLLDDTSSLDIQTIEGDILTITKAETANKARDDYKTTNRQPVKMTDAEFLVKLQVESHIDEIVEASQKRPGMVPDGKNHAFAKNGFTYRRAYFEDFNGEYYEITLSIGHNGTVATVYNVGKINKGVLPSAKVIAVVGSKALGKTPSTNSLSEKTENVNTKNSLSIQGQTDAGMAGKVGWDGRVAVTEATGPNITMDGVTYKLLGLDENGSKVYQDVEVLKEQTKQAEERKEKNDSASATEDELPTQDFEQGERENSKNLYDATVVSPTVKTAKYRKLYNNLEEPVKIQRLVYQCAKEILQHRSGTKFEDMTYINTVTGGQLTRSDYDVENQVMPSKRMREMVRKSEPYTVIALHNHSGSSVPSMADIHSAYVQKYKYGLIVCHDGTIMRYLVTGGYSPVIVNSLLDNIQECIYNNDTTKLAEKLKQLRDENVILEVFK